MQTYRFAAVISAIVAFGVLGGSVARAENFSVLYSFKDTPDGGLPDAALINVGGILYGTTVEGGANNYGSVFTLTPAGSEAVIYSFKGSGMGPDGDGPSGKLIDVNGTFYGTTLGGGNAGCGTVFSVTSAGQESVLHRFDCTDGDGPNGSLVNVNGTLYGTAESGGTADRGTVFKVTRTGKVTVLHSFGATGDGTYPEAGLINVGGTLYGTTSEGGANDLGTVFKISTTGNESVLYSFQSGTDANSPVAPLLDVDGTLYGTAGGGANLCENLTYSCGAVFNITPSGHETVLHSFRGKPDGMFPESGLINVNGTLCGTTAGGGAGTKFDQGKGYGTIFKITVAGAETIVHSLSPEEGIHPNVALLKLGHRLYGSAPTGGASGNGTVFAVEHH
jgi:uncharacterized repeat protein (TIGR03803 family)